MEGSGSRAGSGSIRLTNGSGSGRPKTCGSGGFRIRNTSLKGCDVPLRRLLKGPGPENVYDVIRASKKGGSTRNAGTLHLQAIQIEVRGSWWSHGIETVTGMLGGSLSQCCESASLWCWSGFDLSLWCGSGFYLMRIRVRIFLFVLMRIKSLSAHYFLKLHLHHFSKIKVQKKSQFFFYYSCLMI